MDILKSRERDGWKHLEVPVVFFNGEDQEYVGNAALQPSMEYSKLETSVEKLVGFSLNYISIYRVKNPYSQNPDDDPPKITVAAAIEGDLSQSLSGEDDVILLVVFNRSRMASTLLDLPRASMPNLEDLRQPKRSWADVVRQKNMKAPAALPPRPASSSSQAMVAPTAPPPSNTPGQARPSSSTSVDRVAPTAPPPDFRPVQAGPASSTSAASVASTSPPPDVTASSTSVARGAPTAAPPGFGRVRARSATVALMGPPPGFGPVPTRPPRSTSVARVAQIAPQPGFGSVQARPASSTSAAGLGPIGPPPGIRRGSSSSVSTVPPTAPPPGTRPVEAAVGSSSSSASTVPPTAPPPGTRPVEAGVGSSSSSNQDARTVITYPEPMDDPEVRAWLAKRFEPPVDHASKSSK